RVRRRRGNLRGISWLIQWLQWAWTDCGFNPIFEGALKFIELVLGPEDEVVLTVIEMNLVEVIMSTKPNDLKSESKTKPGLEINSAPLLHEIRNHEFAASDRRQNFVINAVVVLLSIDSKRTIPRINNRPFDHTRHQIHRWIEPHRYES